jgi:energy-coupling factor transporter ATP-binding protein EcfA2
LNHNLKQDFVPASALLVHGPKGSGKSEICSTALNLLFPHTYTQVSCDSFSTVKQLLRAIWIKIIFTKFKYDHRNSSKPASAAEFAAYRNASGYRVVSDFGDLATNLGPFLDSFFKCRNSFCNTISVDGHLDKHIDKHRVDDTTNLKGSKGSSITDNGFGHNPRTGEKRGGVMYLLLDRVDCLEKLEKGLTNKLLRLSEVS